ncbi:MAG: response regulator [Halobacteria archaeon]|nr:response regulator [Halobacteria archaeon]
MGEENNDKEETKVMVVDDEKDVADLYETILSRKYEVVKAYGGEEALERMTEDVGVVFLDRRMPGMSGDEVLDKIRENESWDTRVVMLTAVSPDFDILEMGFDDYLTKPVNSETLYDSVEENLERNEYDDKIDEYITLINKQTALQKEKTPEELEESQEYNELQERIQDLMEELDELRDSFVGTGSFEDEFKRLST